MRINQTYQGVMKLLGEDEQKALRTEQRSWIKERDMVCNLDTRERDRERWYRPLLTDYSKTVCVTRYTRVRTTELNRLLSQKMQEKTAGQLVLVRPDEHIGAIEPISAQAAERLYADIAGKSLKLTPLKEEQPSC